MYTCGGNNEEQLGVKGIEMALSPVRVSALEAHTVHCIACGEGHMLAVLDNGSLAAWGSNEYGQLGEYLTAASQSSLTCGHNSRSHGCMRKLPTQGSATGYKHAWCLSGW